MIKVSLKVSAKIRFIFVFPRLFVINDVIITFFEEKMEKSLEVKKKVVPLHPQSRNNLDFQKCPDGGIGRRAGLKHQWIHFHPGSTPGLGTEKTPQIADNQ